MLRTLLLAIGLAVSLGVAAQARTIPAQAKRGPMSHVEGKVIDINGKRVRLAPGAQIRDASNRIVQPVTLASQVLVKYTLDSQGSVSRVWVLTRQEASQPDKEP